MDVSRKNLSVSIIWIRTFATNLVTISYCYLNGFTIISIGGLVLGFLKLMETILLRPSKPSWKQKIGLCPHDFIPDICPLRGKYPYAKFTCFATFAEQCKEREKEWHHTDSLK